MRRIKPDEKRQETQNIKFGHLLFDHKIQRALIPARVKALVSKWNLDDVGVITVSIRQENGQLAPYVIDGQHRVVAALERGLSDTTALCHVYRHLDLAEEARKFLALNDSRSITPIDRYRIAVVAEDPVCLGIRDILAKYGLVIARDGMGAIRCFTKVEDLYKVDPDVLDAVCRTLIEAWGSRAAAFEQVVFSAMGLIEQRYNGALDHGAFVKKLAGYKGGPAALAGDARGLAEFKPIGVTRAAAEIMVDVYNRGRRSGQLDPL